MVISNYGVLLQRLTLDKIEMIRNWRNDAKISQYMEFKEYITPEMQKKWFDKINNDDNYYFIIQVDNKEVGLINIKDIDYNIKEGEAGIFIYDDEYLNSEVAFKAVFVLFDYCFYKLKLEKIKAHILKTNKRAVKYNMSLGYKIVDSNDINENQLYSLKLDDYLEKRNKLLKFLN